MTLRYWICLILGCLLSLSVHANDEALTAAANGPHRSADNIARNDSRHPVATLEFFGLRPDMTVVEVWPGAGGWYTEILAPYLRPSGRFITANFDGSTGVEYFANANKKFREKLAADPGVYDKIEISGLMPPARLDIAPAGSADLVVSFRNLHNWVNNGIAEQMFEAIFAVLKPGGTLGLVAHRGTPDMVGAAAAKTGYLAESEARRLAEGAGFKFVASAEINANPRDTKDYADGVWTLPPSYRRGDVERDKYAAIGESDRMTLKFSKP